MRIYTGSEARVLDQSKYFDLNNLNMLRVAYFPQGTKLRSLKAFYLKRSNKRLQHSGVMVTSRLALTLRMVRACPLVNDQEA